MQPSSVFSTTAAAHSHGLLNAARRRMQVTQHSLDEHCSQLQRQCHLCPGRLVADVQVGGQRVRQAGASGQIKALPAHLCPLLITQSKMAEDID